MDVRVLRVSLQISFSQHLWQSVPRINAPSVLPQILAGVIVSKTKNKRFQQIQFADANFLKKLETPEKLIFCWGIVRFYLVVRYQKWTRKIGPIQSILDLALDWNSQKGIYSLGTYDVTYDPIRQTA